MTTNINWKLARAELSAARMEMKAAGVYRLLSPPDDNPKLAKSQKIRVLSAPLHLAPASLSGHNVCPMATDGCRAACLHTAGNPVYMAGKTRARKNRTLAYMQHRAAFMRELYKEITAHQRKARKHKMRCAVRLNATSDIPWESVAFTIGGKRFANIMESFPRVQFYDYTKRHNRKNLPPNYSLVYSLADGNDARAAMAHIAGMNVAAVFDVKPGKSLPATCTIDGLTIPVIDGDVHDYRPADPRRVIVGLRAKGRARNDVSGFVRHVS